MIKKKIIFFGAGKFQKKLILLLKKKFFVISIDEDPKAFSAKYSDLFLNFKFSEIDKIFFFLKKKKINPYNIVSFNSDAGFLAAEKLKKRFKIKSYTKKTISIFFDKLKLSNFLLKNKFNVSKFFLVQKKNRKKNYINFFIKPRVSSGSRNIDFISNKNEESQFKLNISKLKNKFIVQKKITGSEYVIDGFVDNDQIVNCLISKKIKFNNNKSVSQIIYTKQNILSKKLQLKSKLEIQRFLQKSKYSYGLFHIEFIINKSKIFIIDAAPRGPGFYVLEDYVLKYLGNNNIYKIINKEKIIKYNKSQLISNFSMVYFFGTKKGFFKKIKIIKKNNCFFFQQFKNNNSLTNNINADNDRLGSITFHSKKNSLKSSLIKINKIFKVIYL